MLNLSNNQNDGEDRFPASRAYSAIASRIHYKLFFKILLGVGIFLLILMFCPWTQNIRSSGYVTTLTPDQRPQTIQSAIPGRIEEWYVREGDFVQKGDTILELSEVQSSFFDPQLVERTELQKNSKQSSVLAYNQRIEALRNKLESLRDERVLKLEQTRNMRRQAELKIQSDSIMLEAARVNLSIAERQFDRVEKLYDEGLKSRLDYEGRQSKLQKSRAKVIDLENKLLTSKNQLLNARMEINRTEASFSNQISQIESDISSAISTRLDVEAQVAQLENTLSNYEIREGMRYVQAPQNGYVNKALVEGIGETFKEGQKLMEIVPADFDIAVETFINPIDLPLLDIGDDVRVQFDGWPAIVFSGWPNLSFGTYGAEVVAIESNTNASGKYRVLLAPDPAEAEWPDPLRVGAGARTIALLSDVPIWYEIWRQLNGFPPNYYSNKQQNGSKTQG